MRRLAASSALAAAVAAGFAGTRAFVAPAQPHLEKATRNSRLDHVSFGWIVRARSSSSPDTLLLLLQQGQQEERRQGGQKEEREAYAGQDDQRRFWDTVVKVITSELGTGEHLSRVWNFVQHNREGKDPPAESPTSYTATGLYFPGLEVKPWWDGSEFSWLGELETAAPDITREMKALAKAGGERSYRGGTGEMSTVYDATKGWGTMRIRYMGRFGQPGVNYALLPRTLSALRRLPLAPETAAFQRQLPGTGLPLHVDPSNFVLGCHLGVVIPTPANPDATESPRVGDKIFAVRDRRRHKTKRGGRRYKASNNGGGGSGGGGGGFGFGGETMNAAGPKKTHDGGDGDKVVGGGGEGSATTTVLHADNERHSTEPKGPGVGGGGGGDGGGDCRVGGELIGERAWIEVSGEKRHWQTGRAFVFDPSFLHRTHNPTAGERVILNVDIWHPGLEEVEKIAIRRVCELVEQWNARSGLFEDEN